MVSIIKEWCIMIEHIILYFISFSIFVVLQSLAINGWHACFEGGCVDDLHVGKKCSGNIFYKISPPFFEKNKGKEWARPLWGCVRCESSAIGALTYWPIVLWLFGFHIIEILVFIFDVFILVYLNYFLYKKL